MLSPQSAFLVTTQQEEFHHLSRVARKWLSFCATSTASERVFSSCKLALNAKRTKNERDHTGDQVKVIFNLAHCGLTIDEISQST
jgi:hypothetical protein